MLYAVCCVRGVLMSGVIYSLCINTPPLSTSLLIYCVLGRGAGERWATRVVVSVEATAVQGDPRGRAGGQEEPTVEVSVYLRPVRGV